jgi:hypothetical protein
MENSEIVSVIIDELEKATKKFGNFNSAHEGYAVILEEMDELWDIVKLNPVKIKATDRRFFSRQMKEIWQNHTHKEMMKKEVIQVAAMAIRFIRDCC